MPETRFRAANTDPLRFTRPVVTEVDRLRHIEQAAYFRAERRHFATGHEVEDWLAAEAEVDAQIAMRPFNY